MTRTIIGIALAHAAMRHAARLGWDRDETHSVARWLLTAWGPAYARRYLQ